MSSWLGLAVAVVAAAHGSAGGPRVPVVLFPGMPDTDLLFALNNTPTPPQVCLTGRREPAHVAGHWCADQRPHYRSTCSTVLSSSSYSGCTMYAVDSRKRRAFPSLTLPRPPPPTSLFLPRAAPVVSDNHAARGWLGDALPAARQHVDPRAPVLPRQHGG